MSPNFLLDSFLQLFYIKGLHTLIFLLRCAVLFSLISWITIFARNKDDDKLCWMALLLRDPAVCTVPRPRCNQYFCVRRLEVSWSISFRVSSFIGYSRVKFSCFCFGIKKLYSLMFLFSYPKLIIYFSPCHLFPIFGVNGFVRLHFLRVLVEFFNFGAFAHTLETICLDDF